MKDKIRIKDTDTQKKKTEEKQKINKKINKKKDQNIRYYK